MIDNTIAQPRGPFALTNGQVVLPQEVVTNKAVVVDDGQIVGIEQTVNLGRDVARIDVDGRIISPGLIDIHIHGAQGHTFNEPTSAAFTTITAENARRGITALLATTATAPIPDLIESLAFIREWMSQPRPGAQVLGAHVEGPYFCLDQKGAQDPANIRNPDDDTPDLLLEYHDVIRIMTYAPELPGALALTARLAKLGIVPAAGHSCAKDEDVRMAMQAGLRHIIHVGCSQSTTVREGLWRKPGLFEASLAFDGLTVEMICDNKHLHPTQMKLIYKCVGPDYLCVISDATSGAGKPEGSRFRMGNMEYEVYNGVGVVFDHTVFAGSTTLLNQMIPILIDEVGISLVEAIRMASLTPARTIGVADRKGSLETGKDADLAIYEADFTTWRTMIGGQWKYVS